MRLLGVDYGHKRIGLALSDPLRMFAQPLKTIAVTEPEDSALEIAELAREKDVALIVIGLPRNMDGTLGPKAREARHFASLIEENTETPIVEWDERLSTALARRSLRQTDMSRKKRDKRVDMVAAQVILQGYLDAHNKGATTKPGIDD